MNFLSIVKTHLARRKPYAPKELELPCGFFPRLISGSKILLLWEQWGFSFTISWNVFLTFTVSSFATILYPDSQKNKRESPETKANQNESFTKRTRRKTTGRRIRTGNSKQHFKNYFKTYSSTRRWKKSQQAWLLQSLKMIMSLNRHSVHSSTRSNQPHLHRLIYSVKQKQTNPQTQFTWNSILVSPTRLPTEKMHLFFSSRLWHTKRFVILNLIWLKTRLYILWLKKNQQVFFATCN